MSVKGLDGQLQCPDPTTFCTRSDPVFCHRGCSGRGTCKNNKCVCPTGWTGNDCAIREHVMKISFIVI